MGACGSCLGAPDHPNSANGTNTHELQSRDGRSHGSGSGSRHGSRRHSQSTASHHTPLPEYEFPGYDVDPSGGLRIARRRPPPPSMGSSAPSYHERPPGVNEDETTPQAGPSRRQSHVSDPRSSSEHKRKNGHRNDRRASQTYSESRSLSNFPLVQVVEGQPLASETFQAESSQQQQSPDLAHTGGAFATAPVPRLTRSRTRSLSVHSEEAVDSEGSAMCNSRQLRCEQALANVGKVKGTPDIGMGDLMETVLGREFVTANDQLPALLVRVEVRTSADGPSSG